MATPYLNDYILNAYPHEKKLRNTPLAQSFNELLIKVRNSGGSVVTPSDIKSKVSKTVS